MLVTGPRSTAATTPPSLPSEPVERPLELVTAEQRRLIDRLEVGRDVSPRIRIALEVADVDTTTTRMIGAGAEPVAQPTETPWRSRNSRLDAPGPIHLTLFQELDLGAQP